MRDTILCLTHSGDFYTIDLVQEALQIYGFKAVRVNCDLFPSQLQFTYKLGSRGAEHIISLGEETEESITTDQIAGVWLRKNCLPTIDLNNSEGKPGKYLSQCIRESDSTKNLFFNSLLHLPWIDPLPVIHKSEDKGLQLRSALSAGLRIPDTLITNRPDDVRGFFKRYDGRIVTKMLTPLTVSMGRPDEFVYTSVVKEEHLNNLEGLCYCPMVFQEKISKAFEIRVAYVAGKCFAGKISTQFSNDKTQVDWRRASGGECAWETVSLDIDIVCKLDCLMKNLGLAFGAIDLIVTPEGNTVFLEVNPCGEWGMLERFLNLPISNEIAKALVEMVKAKRMP